MPPPAPSSPSTPFSFSVSPEIGRWVRLGLGGLWCALAGYALGNAAANWATNTQSTTGENKKKEKAISGSTEGNPNANENGPSVNTKGMDVAVNTDGWWGKYVLDASDLMVAVVACEAHAVGFGTLDNDTHVPASTTLVLRCKFQPTTTVGGGDLAFQIFFDPADSYLRFISKFDLASADLSDEVIAYTAASWNTTMRYCRLTQCGGPAGTNNGPSDGLNLDMVAVAPQWFATQTHAIEWLARLTKVFMTSITRCLVHIRDCRNGSMPFATKDMLEANTVLSAIQQQQQPNSSSSSLSNAADSREYAATATTGVLSSSSYTRSDGDEFCPICLERFVPGDLVRRLPCMHVFHKTKACDIDKHLKRNKQCPTCKTPIDVRYDYLFQAPQEASSSPEQQQHQLTEGGMRRSSASEGETSQQEGDVSEHVADLERMLDGLRESLYNYERMRRAVEAFYHTTSTVIPSTDESSSQIEPTVRELPPIGWRRDSGQDRQGSNGHDVVMDQLHHREGHHQPTTTTPSHRLLLSLPPPPPPPSSAGGHSDTSASPDETT